MRSAPPLCLYKEGALSVLTSGVDSTHTRKPAPQHTQGPPQPSEGGRPSEEAPIGTGGVRLPNEYARSTTDPTSQTQAGLLSLWVTLDDSPVTVVMFVICHS